MNFKNIIIAAIFVSLLFETTLISFPIVVTLCLLAYILYPETAVLIAAFAAGFLLDTLRLSPAGSTLVILAAVFVCIEAVKHSFDLKDWRAILLILFVASFIYASIFSYGASLLVYAIIYGVAALSFFYLSKNPTFRKLLWLK